LFDEASLPSSVATCAHVNTHFAKTLPNYDSDVFGSGVQCTDMSRHVKRFTESPGDMARGACCMQPCNAGSRLRGLEAVKSSKGRGNYNRGRVKGGVKGLRVAV
jgi:hypothetical protein